MEQNGSDQISVHFESPHNQGTGPGPLSPACPVQSHLDRLPRAGSRSGARSVEYFTGEGPAHTLITEFLSQQQCQVPITLRARARACVCLCCVCVSVRLWVCVGCVADGCVLWALPSAVNEVRVPPALQISRP